MLFVVAQQLQLTNVSWRCRMIGKDPPRRGFNVKDVALDGLFDEADRTHCVEKDLCREAVFIFCQPITTILSRIPNV